MDATKVKVRDLMRTNVARLQAEMPVDEAITLLEADRISGGPVVDAAGRVVGVFSLTDIARAKGAEGGTQGVSREYYLPEEGYDEEADDFFSKEDYSPETLGTSTVGEWMSEDIVSVGPDDSARVACKRMNERRVHRVLVLEEGRLSGILSSFDLVRWLAEHG